MTAKKNINVPFLKWAGGKAKIIDRIKELLPEGKKLLEPFCGSATVFLNTNYKHNLIADTNNDVINIYTHLQNEKVEFLEFCRQYFIPENNEAEKYYDYRKEFNETDDKRLRAALFLYLNKHSYNGLCRYNSSGGFNVPFGKYKKVTFPENYILNFIKKAKNAEFVVQDFEATIRNAQAGDVIYCDPPYVPLNASNSSFRYVEKVFCMAQQENLAKLAGESADKGIPVLVSNHLTAFTEEIYKNAQLTKFSVRRSISCKADQREKASEVLALFQS